MLGGMLSCEGELLSGCLLMRFRNFLGGTSRESAHCPCRCREESS